MYSGYRNGVLLDLFLKAIKHCTVIGSLWDDHDISRKLLYIKSHSKTIPTSYIRFHTDVALNSYRIIQNL